MLPAHPDSDSRPALHFYTIDQAILEVAWHEPPAGSGAVPEALVQDIWRLQRFHFDDLRLVDGRRAQVLAPGNHNRDAGPDFLGARLLISGSRCHGPVEIHTKSGIWYEHGHHRDPAYAGVALHVTLEEDLWTGRLRTSTGRVLPELVLAPRLDRSLRTLLYDFLSRADATLPCASGWHSVTEDRRAAWIRRLGKERLQEKVTALETRFLETPDIEQLLYELVLTGLGYSKNTEPMRALARRLPLTLLHRLPSKAHVQAALLGTAGLLPEPEALLTADRSTVDHVMLMRRLYDDFSSTFRLPQMDQGVWQFFRLRPSNFPPLRLAQAGALATAGEGGILAPGGIDTIREAVAANRPRPGIEASFRIDPGSFWHHHVRLLRRARRGFPFIGKQRVHSLFLNAVAPALLLLADHQSDRVLEEHVVAALASMPPEDDEIVRVFEKLGTPPSSGLAAQGYHQLFRAYCRKGRCLACDIGNDLFAQSRPPSPQKGTRAG